MAKKVKVKKSDSNTKQMLLAENAYLENSVSELNEYVNQQEAQIEELETSVAEGELAIEAEQDANYALQDALVDQRKKYSSLVDAHQAKLNTDYLVHRIVQGLSHTIGKSQDKIKELEQDLHHMTIQRDALQDKLKAVEHPVYARKRFGGQLEQFNSIEQAVEFLRTGDIN